jgi:hypothetical protein
MNIIITIITIIIIIDNITIVISVNAMTHKVRQKITALKLLKVHQTAHYGNMMFKLNQVSSS